jgi:hypothetical protein
MSKLTADMAENLVLTCMYGQKPPELTEKSIPSMAIGCPAALIRVARDGGLDNIYKKMMIEYRGETGRTNEVGDAIRKATENDETQVSIGKGRPIDITPAMAWTTGVILTYLGRGSDKRLTSTDEVRKRNNTACLEGTQTDPYICLNVGYLQGQRTLRDAKRYP